MDTAALLVTSILLTAGTPGQDGTFAPMSGPSVDAGPDWWWRSPVVERHRRRPWSGGSIPEDWRVVGGPADYSIDLVDGEPVLLGSGDADRNAFLVDPTVMGDFLLECEVRIASDGGNSGIQIRSDVVDDRMVGYQIEIDPSTRGWSGGLYEEGGRGWIRSLADNLDGRAAFVPGRWNRYEILAVGPRIRSWVNGVPTVDHIDFESDRGLIGFQVHSGRCEVAWRRLAVTDLGFRERVVFFESDRPDDPARGIDLVVPQPFPDGPSAVVVEASIATGSIRIELGDAELGPGYRLTVPAPLGDDDVPGRIEFWRFRDRMRVFVDGAPLEPGPPDLEGDLAIRVHAEPGVLARIHRIVAHPPTALERTILRGDDSTGD